MNTNEHAADDSWSSLAQELGLGDDPAPAPAPKEAEELAPHRSELPDAEDGEDTSLEPGLYSEPMTESAEGEETGEDGKRRRRRRRRRRKGGPAEAGGEAMADSTDSPESFEESDDEMQATETTADIAMRDVVANWNVPSWDELIGGLYRPGN